jgi:hypothetical protein
MYVWLLLYMYIWLLAVHFAEAGMTVSGLEAKQHGLVLDAVAKVCIVYVICPCYLPLLVSCIVYLVLYDP